MILDRCFLIAFNSLMVAPQLRRRRVTAFLSSRDMPFAGNVIRADPPPDRRSTFHLLMLMAENRQVKMENRSVPPCHDSGSRCPSWLVSERHLLLEGKGCLDTRRQSKSSRHDGLDRLLNVQGGRNDLVLGDEKHVSRCGVRRGGNEN